MPSVMDEGNEENQPLYYARVVVEEHLTLDIEAAEFVVDLSNVVRNTGLGEGAARLSRFEGLVEGLRRFARDGSVLVYTVADRSLLYDPEPGLSAAERHRLQEWAADGLIEVRPVADDRILEIADLQDLMIVTNDNYKEYHRTYGWLSGNRDRFLAPHPDPRREGAVLVRRRVLPVLPEWEMSLREEEREEKDAGLRGRDAEQRRRAMRERLWECPEPGCPLFGKQVRKAQSLARYTRRGAICPTHQKPLIDRGRAPRRAQVKVIVNEDVVTRFTLEEGQTVPVGRAPLDDNGIALLEWLSEGARAWMSRTHVELTCEATRVAVRDVSTNGTGIRKDGKLTPLSQGRWRPLARGEEIVLHESTVLVLSGRRRYFDEEDGETPPSPPPRYAEPTMIVGRNGQTGSGKTRRRKGRR